MEVESEPEIKIEHYESLEKDPLCDNNNLNDNTIISTYDFEQFGISQKKLEFFSKVREDCPHPDTKVTWYLSIDSDGRLLCKFCDLKYITEYSLRWHIQKKHLVEYTQLKKLVLLHKRKTSHACRICKKFFISISELKSHVNTKHKIDIIKSSCTECDASFSNINELSVHMYVKHQKNINILSFICEICGYRTKKRSHLKQHFLSHNNDKRLSCPNCDYKTNLKSNLRIHIRSHVKVKSFECQFEDCIYQSSSKASLRNHVLKHFPEKHMLFCDKCNYKTVYKHSLKKHSDSHERNCTRTN